MEKQGIQIEDQVLLFNKDVLRNDKTLKSFGIYKDANVECETIESLIKNYKEQLANQQSEIESWQEKFCDEREQKEQLQDQMLAKLQTEFEQQQNKKSQVEIEQKFGLKVQSEKNSQIFLQGQELQISLLKSQQQPGKQDEVKRLERENVQLRQRWQKYEIEKQRLENKIELLNWKNEQLSQQMLDYNNQKQELMEAKVDIKTFRRELDSYNSRGQQDQVGIQSQINLFKGQIKQLEEQIEEFRIKNQQLEIDKVKLEHIAQNEIKLTQKIHYFQGQTEEYEKKIQGQKAQINSLQDQVNELQNKNEDEMKSSVSQNATVDKIQGYETKIAKLTAEFKSMSIAFDDSQKELAVEKKKVLEHKKKIVEQEDRIVGLEKEKIENNKIFKNKDKTIDKLQYELNEIKNEIKEYQQRCDQLKKVASQENPKIVQEIDYEASKKIDEKLRAREEQKLREEQEEQRKISEKQSKLKQDEIIYQELMLKEREERKKTAQFLKKQMMETHGKIEVCFLIDVTGSMDRYKQQAMKCIRESMKNIKIKTNREVLWATVAYQDFGELKQLGGLYKQCNFTPKPQEIEDFLAALPCTGGGDEAEDIRGGINQMVKKLSWQKTFKIAVLICDAPNHGVKYNGGVGDRYPNEDLEDAIQLMIKNNILFVAILFNKTTLKMFLEIQKIYKSQDREELYIFSDLEKIDEGRIWQELVDLVSQASQRVTQTNNKGTKSKKEQANKRSQLGAMEALCKQIKDPFQFDRLPGVNCVQQKFAVIRVEIKQDSFEANRENIKNLDIHKDFSVFQEGEWQCTRTKKFFAQGQMKQVFLMKRESTQNELYVIKMPLDKTYKTQEAAIIECRSHLISKCLMRKFIRELQEAKDKIDQTCNIPQVQYSDFLILKDLASGNSYWIAERYFAGEFVKYNNNNGFVSDEDSEINHLAQAFTYYTYMISNFNYMVNDVQGVGNYFTDPALNTKEGSFDETDMGVDGQSMFMVNYQGKSHIGKKYLDLLGIQN